MAPNPSAMPYPEGAVATLAKTPITLYRMGLGPLISKQIAILTTRGSKTGLLRNTPVGYMRDGDAFYLVSGWGERANWYNNLRASPDNAALQVGAWRFAVKAEFLETAEAINEVVLKAQESALEFARIIEGIQASGKEVEIVRLTPTGYPPEGEIPTDLLWVWGVLAAPVAFLMLRALFGGGKKEAKPQDEKVDKPEASPAKEAEEDEKDKKGKKAAQREKDKEAKKKGGKLGMAMKVVKIAPMVLMIFRKMSSKQGEDEKMGPKDWLEIGSMVVGVMRQFTA